MRNSEALFADGSLQLIRNRNVLLFPERELLALPIVPTSIYGPQKGGYRLSTLQALAYRSHGGPQGHLEHQCVLNFSVLPSRADPVALSDSRPHRKRLDERAAKAAETRHRNKMCVKSAHSNTSDNLFTP